MWNFRPGMQSERQLEDMEKTLGIGNLKDIPVLDSFPDASQDNPEFLVVLNSGTLYLVFLYGGSRYRVALTSF